MRSERQKADNPTFKIKVARQDGASLYTTVEQREVIQASKWNARSAGYSGGPVEATHTRCARCEITVAKATGWRDSLPLTASCEKGRPSCSMKRKGYTRARTS